ncbi:MAG: hypothetical protein JO086_15210 [Acidimicrobiia bacterium]|nr:hypothetical protein [Acidimicrobiia bacterium]
MVDTVIQRLTEIRDLLRSRGADERPTMPTTHRGVELPLVMAQPVVTDPNLVGKGTAYAPIANVDLHHYTLGEVLISVETIKPTLILTYAAELQVFGVIEGAQDLLATSVANETTGPMRVLLPLGSAFQQLIIQGRQLVNGVPSALGANDASMAGARLQASIKLRVYR